MSIEYIEELDAIVDTTRLNIQFGGGGKRKLAESEAFAIVARYKAGDKTIQGARAYLESIGHPMNLNALTDAETRVRNTLGERIMPYRRD